MACCRDVVWCQWHGKAHGNDMAMLYGPSQRAVIYVWTLPWHTMTRHGNAMMFHGNTMMADVDPCMYARLFLQF